MRLRKLAKSCDFSEPEKEIANQVVFSCSSQALRRRALREDLELDELVKLARSLEISEIQATKVETSHQTSTASVYAINDRQHSSHRRNDRPHNRGSSMSRGRNRRHSSQSNKSTGKSGLCDYCGYQASHSRCPARGKTCSACLKVGHFSSVCRSSRRQNGHHHRQEAPSHQSANTVQLHQPDNDSDTDYAFTAHEVPYPSENILSTKTPTSRLPTRSVRIANTAINMTQAPPSTSLTQTLMRDSTAFSHSSHQRRWYTHMDHQLHCLC